MIKFLHSMCNKTIGRFGFCDIQNNQGLSNDWNILGFNFLILFLTSNCIDILAFLIILAF